MTRSGGPTRTGGPTPTSGPARTGGPTRVGAIDCGTNSVRLLIADLDPSSGRAVEVERRMEIVRLGEGVDRTGRLGAPALERTFAALRDYERQLEELGVGLVRMAATSATRDAENRDDFVEGVEWILGIRPEIISGVEEAALSFAGATRELPGTGAEPPYLVVDIGGGSTEFVLGSDEITASRSVDIGCVRLAERHLRSDPPSPEQIAAAEEDIGRALDAVAATVPLETTRTLVGVAGTVTTVAGIAHDLPAYDSARIHLSRVTSDAVRRVSSRLLAMPRTDIAVLPIMHPGRVDVIAAGGLVLRSIVDRVGRSDLVASEHDILDGLAWSLV